MVTDSLESFMRAGLAVVVCVLLVLTGCGSQAPVVSIVSTPIAPLSDVALTGVVSSGAQPIVGAHVYLLAVNATGYGGNGTAASASNASVSTVSEAETGASDSVGAYVTTNANGGFSLTGDYSCSSGQQLYVYALGGNTGLGVNSAAGLMAVVGSCPSSSSAAITVAVNEVSTVAAAYALAGFATDATHVSSSGTALAQVGVANAFANAGNMVNLSSGVALATTPAGNGTVPQAEINTLAGILASCVNSAGSSSSACSTLFADTGLGGSSVTAADTAMAAISIAHNPGANVTALYGLLTGSTAFTPKLTAQPNDFTVALNYAEPLPPGTSNIAIDGAGNAWIAASQLDGVLELSSRGSLLSGANGYTGGNMSGPDAVAIDSSGNAWVTNGGGYAAAYPSLTEISGSGTILSGANGYTGGGLNEPNGIAIDGSGNVWAQEYGGSNLFEFSSSGLPLPGVNGSTFGALAGPMAIDGSSDLWIVNGATSGVTKFSNRGSVLSGLFFPINPIGSGGIAIDASGHVWITGAGNSSVAELSSSGSVLSGASGFPVAGVAGAGSIAIDGAGNAWITSYYSSTIAELSNSGSTISGASGYVGGGLLGPISVAIDGSGDVWVANNSGCKAYFCSDPWVGSITEFIGTAVPVVTPLAAGVKNNTLGTRP
jgi:hypothetical protein